LLQRDPGLGHRPFDGLLGLGPTLGHGELTHHAGHANLGVNLAAAALYQGRYQVSSGHGQTHRGVHQEIEGLF
jgi:hypothetical protein